MSAGHVSSNHDARESASQTPVANEIVTRDGVKIVAEEPDSGDRFEDVSAWKNVAGMDEIQE